MHKIIKSKGIYLFLMFIVLLSFLLFWNFGEEQEIEYETSITTFKENITSVNLNDAFNKSYYHNNHDAIFSSMPLSAEPDLYLIDWNLQLANLLELDFEISENISSFLYDRLINTSDIYELNLLIDAYSYSSNEGIVNKKKSLN